MDSKTLQRRKPATFIVPLTVLAGILCSAASQAQKYSAEVLQKLPGGTFTSGSGMNNAGQVAGQADDEIGNIDAVIWNRGAPTVIVSNPVFGYAAASAINNSGTVVGNQDTIGAFVWSPSFYDGACNSHTFLTGINDLGWMIGDLGGHATVLTTPTDLGDCDPGNGLASLPGDFGLDIEPLGINGGGVVVGVSYTESTSVPHATRWNSSGVADLGTLGGTGSQANAINNNGYIVGWANLKNGWSHAALWGPRTKANDLGTLGGKNSNAGGINIEGDVAGSAQTAAGVWHAVLWTHKHYLPVDLNNEISSVLARTVTLTGAAATNDRCMILVDGYVNKTGAAETFVLSLTDQTDCDEP